MTEATQPQPSDWIDLRFHRTLYAGEAVDEAVQRYRRHIECELREHPEAWHVRLRALQARAHRPRRPRARQLRPRPDRAARGPTTP
jgi:hypothetical protein